MRVLFCVLVLTLAGGPAPAFTGEPSPDKMPAPRFGVCREERIPTAGGSGWAVAPVIVLHCLRATRFRPRPHPL
jgi:hypothetical protein